MRMSAPSALACSSDLRVPGTRIASPKVVKITPGRSAICTASSTRAIGSTQTGQPGPWMNSSPAGTSLSSP